MRGSLFALEWLRMDLAGRINEHHLGVIDDLMEKSRALRELHGKKRPASRTINGAGWP
ncbi:MAG: hypothetical protein ACYTGG_06540 [Planctomycetota bacterium]|jgi:hypothetical protein